MYINFRKKINSWAIGYTTREHNHPINPVSLSHFFHRSRWVGHDKAKELARGLWREASFKKAQRIIKNHDLSIERKEFYNLTQKATKKLQPQEELTLLLACLDQEDFRVWVHDTYTLNDTGITQLFNIN